MAGVDAVKPELERKLRDGIRAADVQRRAKNRLMVAPGSLDWAVLDSGPFPRDVINKMVEDGDIASPKQAWRTLEKWSRLGLYDYGVTLDLGWLEEPEALPADSSTPTPSK